MKQEFYQHPFFLKAFDRKPGERVDDIDSIQGKEERDSLIEYKGYIDLIVSRLTVKSFIPGQFVCNRGDPGDEMYYIRYGSIGVYLNRNDHDLVRQRHKMAYTEELYHKTIPKEIPQVQIESEAVEILVEQTGAKFLNQNLINRWKNQLEHETYKRLILMINQIKASNLWSSNDLYLLGSTDPLRYYSNDGFLYAWVNSLPPNTMLGDQSLAKNLPRNATLISLVSSKLYCLSKQSFDEVLGSFIKRAETRKTNFFGECFKHIVPGKLLSNLFVLFPLESVARGHVICLKGQPIKGMYILEDGEAGLLQTETISLHGKMADLSQCDFLCSVEKYSIFGDEWLLGENQYSFTVVALKQPTSLYFLPESAFMSFKYVLGSKIVSQMASLAARKVSHRKVQDLRLKSKLRGLVEAGIEGVISRKAEKVGIKIETNGLLERKEDSRFLKNMLPFAAKKQQTKIDIDETLGYDKQRFARWQVIANHCKAVKEAQAQALAKISVSPSLPEPLFQVSLEKSGKFLDKLSQMSKQKKQLTRKPNSRNADGTRSYLQLRFTSNTAVKVKLQGSSTMVGPQEEFPIPAEQKPIQKSYSIQSLVTPILSRRQSHTGRFGKDLSETPKSPGPQSGAGSPLVHRPPSSILKIRDRLTTTILDKFTHTSPSSPPPGSPNKPLPAKQKHQSPSPSPQAPLSSRAPVPSSPSLFLTGSAVCVSDTRKTTTRDVLLRSLRLGGEVGSARLGKAG